MGAKAIIALFRQDLVNATRDNIILYMIVAPILLAVGARLLLPSLAVTQLRFAVERSVETRFIEGLAQFGEVEVLPTADEVRERTGRSDDVPGIILDDTGRLRIILEGNEQQGAALANLVMASLLRDEDRATILVEQVRAPDARLSEYSAVILAMIAVLMGGMSTGFIMVDEKESGVVRALAVSPLTMGQYTAARALFALLISTLAALVGSAILVGGTLNYALLLLACLIAAAVGLVLGYIIGGFASNQLEAVALIKIIMFAYLTVPVATIFVPANWQFLFYWLPNYWMFKNFETLFAGQVGPLPFWATCLLTLGVSAVYVAGLLPRLRSKIRLRYA